MKRWQKAAILLVVTPLLALATQFVVSLLFVGHFFLIARCSGLACQDYGTELYAVAFWIAGIAFTIYFFFAFVWLFRDRPTAPDAPRS